MSSKRSIYFAAPLHDDADQQRNNSVVTQLRAEGYTVYLPQEHGKWEDLVAKFGGKDATRRYLYQMDLHAMQRADCCVAYVLRDKGPSEGMLWEMGYMSGCNKPVFLINPGYKHGYNLMPEFGSMVFDSVQACIDHLKEEDFIGLEVIDDASDE